MVNNNKILTVSYGTFSCTLEGFDDSFDTMKAIAEYFRDLASDDRYFGAEPPVPDAEMLARIAQREISRKVEAHEGDSGGILLRAKDMPHAAALTANAAEAPAVTEPEPDSEPVQVTDAPEAKPVSEEPISQELVAEVETVGDSGEIPAEAVDVLPDVQPEDVAMVSEEAPAIEERWVDTMTSAEVYVGTVVENTPEAPATVAVEASENAVVAEMDELVAEPDSIAAKLQRIRAVVSRNEAEAQIVDYAEDQHADAYVVAIASEMTDALNEDDEALSAPAEDDGSAEVLDALKRLDAAFEPEADEVEDLAEDLIPGATFDTGLLDAFADIDEPVEIKAEDEEAGVGGIENPEEDLDQQPIDETSTPEASTDENDAIEPFAETPDGEDDDSLSVEIEEIDQDDAVTTPEYDIFAHEDDTGEPDPETADMENATVASDESDIGADGQDDAAADMAEQAVVEGDPQSPQVIKVKRADFEAAISEGELEDITEDTAGDAVESSLSPEAEDELMRELAQVEAELGTFAEVEEPDVFDTSLDSGLDSDLDEDVIGTDQEYASFFEASQPEDAEFEEEDDDDLSRLMAAANEKMGGEETTSTHEAYNQMRAAVAVAEAERSATGDAGDEALDDVYREDLASVVRPRRPVSAGIRPERPATEDRPAPLKLVAEQRIDTDAGLTQRGPVRPRRVASAPLDDAAGLGDVDNSFAEFASEMGATELPDLLEAAAAYLSFVEGRAQFSRPQLMNKVRQIDSSNFNREDGLRSFGRLLREGKIEKTGGGRFTASGDIGFRPDERAAAG